MNHATPTLSSAKLEKAARILKAVAHPLRLRVVDLLRLEGPMTVGEINERCPETSQPLLSHHLGQMRTLGVLNTEREGKHIRYSLGIENLTQLIDCIDSCCEA